MLKIVSYKIEVMINSLIKMLELTNFGNMSHKIKDSKTLEIMH